MLALQGDVREHLEVLGQLGCVATEVRTTAQLGAVDALVIPGGESTTIFKLAEIFGLLQPLREAIANGLPVLGTCAGLILLAAKIVDPASGQQTFGGLDISVRRNAFGNQNDSFETEVAVSPIDKPVRAAFIRAPIVESLGPGVEAIASLPDGRVVGVRQGKVIGISFHPEMYGDSQVHQLLIDSI